MSALPEIVSADTWAARRAELLVLEKEATRTRDALASTCRRLPMVEFPGPYAFHARDTSLIAVSHTPWDRLGPYRERMGWHVPFFSSAATTIDADCGTTDGFGLSVFLRGGDRVFRSYFTAGRATEMLGSHRSFLDLTPFGRQESWEDSPPGRPQTPPYQWWRLHDEYPSDGRG